MNVLDLFSGIGGFSLGLERAGMKTVAFCEIEEFPRKVLAKHWPDVPIYEDVRELSRDRLESDGVARIDVICGGFPCQDISVAGKGAGLAGERSGLWTEFARLIGEIRPRYVIIENVSALISGRDIWERPTDRCVCGWTYRWRRLPLGPEQGGSVVYTALRHGDVGKGKACSGDADQAVRRQSHASSQAVGKMGSRLALGDQREEVPCDAGEGVSASGAQGRTGASDAEYIERARRDDQGAGCRVEPEGAERDAGGRLVCPACGRPVAGAATRSGVATWMGRVLGDLAEIGYDAEWHCIPASYVGAPHRRDRVWIVAYPQREGREGRETARDNGKDWKKPRLEQLAGCCGVSRRSWATEPAVGRVVDGLPSRVDRLKGLGNAVVPQIPELIGRAIMEVA